MYLECSLAELQDSRVVDTHALGEDEDGGQTRALGVLRQAWGINNKYSSVVLVLLHLEEQYALLIDKGSVHHRTPPASPPRLTASW